MHVFRDNNGRDWCIEINVASVKRTKALMGVDLYGLVDARFEGLDKLLGNPCDLVDVLYCLVKAEADKRGITDEDFGRGMGGDSLQRASDAFMAELIDFFPDPRVRAGLTKVLEKSRTLRNLLMDQMERDLDAMDLDSEARKLIDSSGRRPESSVSIPAHSRSANSS
jgi:hypothetical protein